jgi:hypothetical protein
MCLGHLPELERPKEIGDADISWTRDYGSAIRIKGPFGVRLHNYGHKIQLLTKILSYQE